MAHPVMGAPCELCTIRYVITFPVCHTLVDTSRKGFKDSPQRHEDTKDSSWLRGESCNRYFGRPTHWHDCYAGCAAPRLKAVYGSIGLRVIVSVATAPISARMPATANVPLKLPVRPTT